MKKKVQLLLMAVFMSSLVGFGQVPITGIKTIPGNYPTIAYAIAALNADGVGSGGVTFAIAAGYMETFSSPGDGLILATGAASDPIVFQKDGIGANPVVIAATGNGLYDYIFCIAGGDYITFDGIDIHENSLNTDPTTLMEYGFALFKNSVSNGAQFNTIKNGTITLGNNPGNWGIFSQNWDYTGRGTTITPTAASGTNSYNKFYNLTFNNCYDGILLYGFANASPYSLYDQGNEVGKDGAITINGLGWGGAGPNNIAVNANGIVAWYQNILTVANCSITGPVDPGFKNNSSFCFGIYLGTGINSSYNIYSNTISVNYSAQGGFGAIYSAMGKSGTGNSVNIYNNTIKDNILARPGNANIECIALYTGITTLNIYGNLIDNNIFGLGSINDTSSGGSTMNYLYVANAPTTQGSVNIYNNTITKCERHLGPLSNGGNTNLIKSDVGANSTMNIYNNIIDNIYIGTNMSTFGIQCISAVTTRNVYNNSITNLYRSGGYFYVMTEANASTAKWYKNKVQYISHDVENANPIYGFISSSGGPALYLYNNFIGDLSSPLSTGTIYGMYFETWTKLGLYNNTIYLNNTPTGTGNASIVGIYGLADIGSLDMRNNLIINNSTPLGTGKVIAFQRSSTAQTSYASTSNNNDFYAGTPSVNNLIFSDGTNFDQTLTVYKARVWPRDNQSVSELPPFANISTRPYDLHLLSSTPTQCESSGTVVSTPVAVTTDYDNDSRYPNSGYPDNITTPATAPDMGADEFGGLVLDITSPNITFTPLLNTSVTGDRTLTTTITDPSGVPTSGSGLPVLYWKINSGSWSPVTATWVSGTTYTFTFGAGTVLNDVVSYYIVAQDLVAIPNPGANPLPGASGYTASPPTCSTPPTTPITYTIVGSLSGLYTVGSGKNYTTLTAAIADLNLKEVVGPVTFELWDATYSGSETFPLTINNYLGASSTNTVTIKPKSGGSSTITGSSASGILRLNGSKYVIIDGSNSGASDKNLTVTNTNTAANTYAIGLLNNGSQGASNCTIKNCNLKASSQITNNTYGLFLSTTGGGYANIVIDNNSIFSARYGIQFAGASGNTATNGQITNNIIGTATTATEVKYCGIYVTQADNTLIQGNEIMGPSAGNTNTQQAGIWLASGVTNTKIRKNKIHDFYYTGTSGYGAFGIYLNTGSSSTVTEISNNLLYYFRADGTTATNQFRTPAGIQLYTGGNAQIYHNTIYLSGACLSGTAASFSSCISVCSGTSGTFDIRDNILKNSMQPSAGTANFTYGIYSAKATGSFSNLNYNDYYIDGIQPNVGFMTANQATLSAWQTITGKEINGKNIDPVFASATDLHPTAASLYKLGSYLSAVTSDFAGTSRTNPPDMGAYQVSPNHAVITSAANSVEAAAATLNGSIDPLGNTVVTGFEYGLTTAYGTSVTATPASVSGSTLTSISANITGLAESTTYHFRARGTSGAVTVYGSDLTFTTPSSFSTLNLKVFLEGLYNGSGGMNQAMDCTDGENSFPVFITYADTVTVALAEDFEPDYSFVHYFHGVGINTDGTLTVEVPGTVSGDFYVVLQHRNSVETWSAQPVTFPSGTLIGLDWTLDSNNTYGFDGGNERPGNGVSGAPYVIYSGEVCQTDGSTPPDGYIDGGDVGNIFNLAQIYGFGYKPEDLTGDGFIDGFDVAIVFNNAQIYVGKETPKP